MIKSIKTLLATVATAGALLFPALVPVTAMAATATSPDLAGSLCGGVNLSTNTSTDCTNSDKADSTIDHTITVVINTFSVIVGFISVLMIIYGGFKYITSGGDSGKVTAAKNSIMYALIGLIVVAVAQLLVKFVITKATTITN